MRNPRMGRSKRPGVAGVAVAALGLLLGMTFVGPVRRPGRWRQLHHLPDR